MSKLWLLVATICALGLIWRLTPLRHSFEDFQTFKAGLARAGWSAPILFGLVSALGISFGLSRLFFCGLAGATFGFASGFVYSEVAAVAGAYGAFLYARWLAGDWAKKRFETWERIDRLIQRNAWLGIILVRQLPISGVFLNVGLALTKIRHRTFLLGSALAFIPEGAVATLVGSGSLKGNWRDSLWQIVLAVLLAAAIAWGGRKMAARLGWKNSQETHG